ncbi:transmembrane protein 91-like [Arapaima gigas]
MMESLDELQYPLLGSSPKHVRTSGIANGSAPFKATLSRAKEERSAPPLTWNGYCALPELQQPQFLNPCSLPSAPGPFYTTGPLCCNTDPLGLHYRDYLETTFMDNGPEFQLERKLEEAKDVHSVTYSIEDEDDLLPDYEDSTSEEFSDTDSESSFTLNIPQDYLGLAFFSMLCCFWPLGIAAFYLSQKTNKAFAQGNFKAASTASRQVLWLSVLSIIFGVITYICAVVVLIIYLSGKPP